MNRRAIVLGDGRRIGLGRYIAAWQACRAMDPDAAIGRGVSGWGETASEALRQLRRGMHDRINRHDPAYGRGRKWSEDWQRQTLQAAHRLNTPRLIVDWLPADLRDRFRDRLRESDL